MYSKYTHSVIERESNIFVSFGYFFVVLALPNAWIVQNLLFVFYFFQKSAAQKEIYINRVFY